MKTNELLKTMDAGQILATVGYEKKTIDSFLHLLTSNGIETLIDVRQRAASRSRGYAKTALSNSLVAAGIAYRHMPELGTPAELRRRFKDGALSLAQYSSLFETHLDSQEAAMAELADLVKQQSCCLLCVEACHEVCHRSVVVKKLQTQLSFELEVRHL